MYTLNPTGLFGTEVTTDSTGITIPYSALESYDVASSGDVRQFLYSVLEKTADLLVNLPATGVDGRWTKVSVTRNLNAVSADVLRKTYTFGIDLSIGNLDVVSET
jgi:hypothetical protein